MFTGAEKGDKHIPFRLMRGCAPKHYRCCCLRSGPALLMNNIIWPGWHTLLAVVVPAPEKNPIAIFWANVWLRRAGSTSPLPLIPNLTLEFHFTPQFFIIRMSNSCLNFTRCCCCILCLIHQSLPFSKSPPLRCTSACDQVLFWSSADHPARIRFLSARFSRRFTCRRSSGMRQLLHGGRREIPLFLLQWHG